MSRVFTAEEVNAALELAAPGDAPFDWQGWQGHFGDNVPGWVVQGWWEGVRVRSLRIAALALGVLPEGWSKHDYGEFYQRGWNHGSAKRGSVAMEIDIDEGAISCVFPEEWPAAVRDGHAETACRLIAAHVELERLRAQKGGAE